MSQQVIIFTDEEIKKLQEGRPVSMEETRDLPNIVFMTEKGYQEFLEFWGETDDCKGEIPDIVF